MDCKCAVTFKTIIRRANIQRKRAGRGIFSYQQGRLAWIRIVNAYDGKRNPYLPHNKIGVSYIFTEHAAGKIAAMLAVAEYNFMPGFDPWKNRWRELYGSNRRIRKVA